MPLKRRNRGYTSPIITQARRTVIPSESEKREWVRIIQNSPDAVERAAAQEKLVNGLLPFVLHVARRASKGEQIDPAVLTGGAMGILTAAERFDLNRGTHFLGYAFPWIYKYVVEVLNEGASIGISLNTPRHSGEKTTIGTSLPVEKGNPEEIFLARERKAIIQRELGKLDPRSRQVVSMIYGMENEARTLAEVGRTLGFSKTTAMNVRNSVVERFQKIPVIRELSPRP